MIIRATNPDATTLDDHSFLGLSDSSYDMYNFFSITGLPGDQSRRQLLYYIMWCNYLHDREGMRVPVPREKDFSLNPMRAYKRPTKPWKVFCGSLPSMRYHRFCHFYPFIPRRIPPGRHFLSSAYRRNPYSLEFQSRLKVKLICTTNGRTGFNENPTPPSQRESWHKFFGPLISLSVPVYHPPSISRVSIPLQYSAFNPPDVLRSKSPSRASMAPWPERGT